MGVDNVVAERLRRFVRDRVRPGGEHYRRGAGTRLAEAIGIDRGWVNYYTDVPPTRHADLDQALAICQYFKVDLMSFVNGEAITAPPSEPSREWKRCVRLLERMSADGLIEAAVVLGPIVRAYPQPPESKRSVRHVDSSSATVRKVRGRR